jgi:hypothetical protein
MRREQGTWKSVAVPVTRMHGQLPTEMLDQLAHICTRVAVDAYLLAIEATHRTDIAADLPPGEKSREVSVGWNAVPS